MPPEAATAAPPEVVDAYRPPEPLSPAPPQSYPRTRDVEARERTLEAFRRMERRLVGQGERPDAITGAPVEYDLASETQNADLEFFQQGYDARMRVLHEPDAVLDEHQRLQEVNALYLDQCMEGYMERVTATEADRERRKHGDGWVGGLRRWFSETDLGKAVHLAGKVGIAGAALGLLPPPAGLLLAEKLGTDAILEGVQYAFERPVLQDIRELRLRRHENLMTLTALRNEVANRNDDHDLAANAQQLNIGGSLHDNLEAIITEFDNIEREMIEREERLALIKMIGKSIRAAASIAWSAVAIHELFTHGLAMGTANLDKLHDPTLAEPAHAFGSTVHGAHGITDPVAAGHHLVHTGSNPGVYHDLRLASDGVRFVYEQGEWMGGAMLAHGTGMETHLVGSMYSAGAAAAAYTGFGAAALVGWPTHIYGAIRDNHFRATMRDVRIHPLAEGNKQHEAVFTLTGRDALGDRSGVEHEISEMAGITRGNEEFRRGLEIKKTKFVRGSIFKVPRELVMNNASQMLPPFVTTEQEFVYIQVNGWRNNGDGRDRDLEYIIFDPDAQRPLFTNDDGIVANSTSRLWKESKADQIIDQADRVATSYQEFFDNRTEAAQILRLKEARGFIDIAEGQSWQAEDGFQMATGNNAQQINPGYVIEIQTLQNDKTRAVVNVFDDSGRYIGQYSGVRVVELMQHTHNRPDRNQSTDRPITLLDRLEQERGHEDMATNQRWQVVLPFTLTHTGGTRQMQPGELIHVRSMSPSRSEMVVRVQDASGRWSADMSTASAYDVAYNCIKMTDQDMPVTDVDKSQETHGHERSVQKGDIWEATEDFTLHTAQGDQQLGKGSKITIKSVASDKAEAAVRVQLPNGDYLNPFNGVRIQDILDHGIIHEPTKDTPANSVDQLREQLGPPKMASGDNWRAGNDFNIRHIVGGNTVTTPIPAETILHIQNISETGTRATVNYRDTAGAPRDLIGVDVQDIYGNAAKVDLDRERRDNNARVLGQIQDLLRGQNSNLRQLQPDMMFLYRNNADPAAPAQWVGIRAVDSEAEGGMISFITADLANNGEPPTGNALKNQVNRDSRSSRMSFEAFLNRFSHETSPGVLQEELVMLDRTIKS